MNKLFKKTTSFLIILSLVLFLIPVVNASNSSSNISFGINPYTPRPYPSTSILLVPKIFDFAVPITSVKAISKVTVTVENFKAVMAFSLDASCHYCEGYITKIDLGNKSSNGLKKIVVKATDVNGYSATHDYYVTLGDPDHPTPSPELNSNKNSVFTGQPFDVEYKLSNLSQSIYSQDISIAYDSQFVDFVCVESKYKIVQKTVSNGVIHILLSGTEIKKNTDSLTFLKLHFKAKKLATSTTTSVTAFQINITDNAGVGNYYIGTNPINIIKK